MVRDLVGWAAAEARRLRCSEVMASGIISRVREGLGGSHTVVTYPPLDALEPVDPLKVRRAVTAGSDINLYAHIAFCEHICPFCHYAKTYSPIGGESELVRSYIDALLAEVDVWMNALSGSTVASVYVGGGTPTALSEKRLLYLLQKLTTLRKADRFVACVETSPLTLCAPGGREKVQALVEFGVGRLSIGVQTFDDALLRQTRAHPQEVAVNAVAGVAALGVEYNVDMIQDLPYQTDESLVADIEWIGRFRPNQVTWYVLRVHPESAWYGVYRRDDLELPAAFDSVRRRLLVREGMRRIGYTAMPGGRFVADAKSHDRFKEVRGGTEEALLGMGVAAYSHGWGYFFRNSSSMAIKSGIRDYVQRIRSSGLAIESALKLNPSELAAARVVAGIRAGISLSDHAPEAAPYVEEASATLAGLSGEGLVTADPAGRWSLTELGWVFEEEICSLLYSTAVKRRLVGRHSYWAAPQLPPSVDVTSGPRAQGGPQ